MRKSLLRAAVTAAILAACMFAQTNQRIAVLRLHVTNSHGQPVEGWRVTKLVDRAGRDWKGSVTEDGTARIPAGDYSLQVSQEIFLPFDGTVRVRAPVTDFIAGLLFGGIEDSAGEDNVVGRFEVPPGPGSWCKLTGLFTGSGHFAAVDMDGRFRFTLVPSETYALVCWKGAVTLDVRIIDTKAGSNPEIVVGTAGPSQQGK